MPKAQNLRSLSYAVRLPVVLKYFGQLLAVFALLFIAPMGVALFSSDYQTALAYIVVMAVLGISGFILYRIRAGGGLQLNEALAITSLIFIASSLAATFPMMQSGLGFLDALFESISGITTTGLTTVGTVEDKPAAFLFARAWMQWVGGLGIVILTVALLFQTAMAAKKLAYAENETEDLVGGAHIHARRVLSVYLMLTGMGVLVLWLMRVDPFDAVVHVLAAVSTGGFSTHDASLEGFKRHSVQAVLTAISTCGAVSFVLYYRAYISGWRELWRDVELRFLVALCLMFSLLLIAVAPWQQTGMSLSEAAWKMPLTAFSAQTTTGFAATDIAGLSPFIKLVLIVQMAVGGMVGSTAGGMKILRLLILFRVIQLVIIKTALPPHAVAEPRLGESKLAPEEVERALMVVMLFIALIILSWLPFLVFGHDPLNALFEVVSAVGTVGLSTGVCGPELEPLLKGVLCFDMLMGRLEIIALLVILYPGTWFGRRAEEGT